MSRVVGVDAFRDAMAGHEDKYVLIGGGACSLLFENTPHEFRLTHDLDVVVLASTDDDDFGRALWSFAQKGGYTCGMRANGSARYYRFELPKSKRGEALPQQIELFSRRPQFVNEKNLEIAPLPFNGVVSSLSAIVLDDGYFEFIRSGVINRDGIPIPDALHVIPLKMRAHIDLNDRHAHGEHVNGRDLKKHRNDVLSLAGLLTDEDSCPLTGNIAEDASRFLDGLPDYASRLRMKERQQVLETTEYLREVYSV